MKKIAIILLLVIASYQWGCDSDSTAPDGNSAYVVQEGANYFYNQWECDSLWNITSDTIKLTLSFSAPKYYPGTPFNVFTVSNSDKEFGSGEAAFLPNSFILNTKFGIPFVDTNFVGEKLPGYAMLNIIKYDPFDIETNTSILRDTAIVEWLLMIKFAQMIPAMIIQEWSSNVLADTIVDVLGNEEKCKNVEIYLNRLIRHKYDWAMKPFPRPSDDPKLDEFYTNNDKEIYADKIKMQLIYKEKIGFVEIFVSHRSIWGNKYTKWKLTRIP